MRPLLSLTLLLAGCSAVLPLGDEYTFDTPTVDAGPPMDAQVEPDAGEGVDAGPACTTVPTMETACADACGTVTVCEMSFDCGGCTGELMCGASTPSQCGCAAPPCALNSESYGDIAEQRIAGIAVDFMGNVFVAGSFRGTLTIGSEVLVNPGMRWNDIFLAKLDPTGNVLWARSFGTIGDGPGDDDDNTAVDLAVDGSGNVVITGESNGRVDFGGGPIDMTFDLYLAKFGPDGTHIFSDAYGTDFSVNPVSVETDPAGGDIILAGDFWGTLRFGSLSSMTAAGTQSYFDMFVARFDPDGTPRRSRRFGDGQEQLVQDIAVSGSNVHMAAIFNGTFDFGAPNTVTVSTTSFYALALSSLSTSFFSHQWTRQMGTDVSGVHLAADVVGNLFVGGSFDGALEIDAPPLDSANGDAFLARLNPDGTTGWTQQSDNLRIESLSVGPDGSLYIAGSVRGPVDLGGGPVGTDDGTTNPFLAHLAADGTHLWSRSFDAPVGNQAAVDIGSASDGSVWIGLNFEGQVDVGAGELRTQGGNDIGLARYSE